MSHLIVSGLNYHSSPIAIRERFTIPSSCLKHALHALATMPHIEEAAVLSTCNRTEVYAVVSNVQAGMQEIDSFFLSTRAVADHDVLRPNFKLLREDVVLHLFRVASGLDSMVLGEGQILSQVKDAHQVALDARTAGPLVDQLFKLAINCGKRVRTETSMGRRAVSVSSAAIELGRSILGPLGNRTTLVVGAGRMAKVSVKLLLNEHGTGPVLLVNRGQERIAQILDNDLPNRQRLKTGFGLEEIHDLAAAADLVIVSTSAPDYLLTYEALSKVSRTKELCVIDISVPRNADPRLAELPGIKLFHADDLSAIVNKNLAERESLVSEAEQIIFESLDGFHGWQRSLLVVPTITELRQKIEAIRMSHMEKTQVVGDAEFQASTKSQLEDISRAIVNQILHHPTVQLKATTDYQALRQKAEALRTLFNLDSLTPLASQPNTTPPAACPYSANAQASSPDKLTQIDQTLQDFASRLKESLIEL